LEVPLSLSIFKYFYILLLSASYSNCRMP